MARIPFDPMPSDLRAYWAGYVRREGIRLGLEANVVSRIRVSEAPAEALAELYGHHRRLMDMMASRARQKGVVSLSGEPTHRIRALKSRQSDSCNHPPAAAPPEPPIATATAAPLEPAPSPRKTILPPPEVVSPSSLREPVASAPMQARKIGKTRRSKKADHKVSQLHKSRALKLIDDSEGKWTLEKRGVGGWLGREMGTSDRMGQLIAQTLRPKRNRKRNQK
jgi:hypothetical protein